MVEYLVGLSALLNALFILGSSWFLRRHIEGIKLQNQQILEAQSQHHALRMAALDLRLKAHQEAYSLWLKLATAPSKAQEHVMRCQEWWGNNCLFLDAASRKAFRDAYLSAHAYGELMGVDKEDALYFLRTLNSAGAIIESGVGLPSIGEDALNLIKPPA